jgi:hypothetical protein
MLEDFVIKMPVIKIPDQSWTTGPSSTPWKQGQDENNSLRFCNTGKGYTEPQVSGLSLLSKLPILNV